MASYFKKTTSYFKESYDELKKVVWPTREVTRNHSILVIAFSLFVAVFFAASDYILNYLLQLVI